MSEKTTDKERLLAKWEEHQRRAIEEYDVAVRVGDKQRALLLRAQIEEVHQLIVETEREEHDE